MLCFGVHWQENSNPRQDDFAARRERSSCLFCEADSSWLAPAETFMWRTQTPAKDVVSVSHEHVILHSCMFEADLKTLLLQLWEFCAQELLSICFSFELSVEDSVCSASHLRLRPRLRSLRPQQKASGGHGRRPARQNAKVPRPATSASTSRCRRGCEAAGGAWSGRGFARPLLRSSRRRVRAAWGCSSCSGRPAAARPTPCAPPEKTERAEREGRDCG